MNIIWLAMKLLKHRDILDRVKEVMPGEPDTPGYVPAHPVGSVEWLQDALNLLNHAELEVDEVYGEQTRAAVEQYQTDEDLKIDGWAGPETIARLVEQLSAL